MTTLPVAAQFTASFQTNIINGVTSNWPGNYLVGSNIFADVLILQAGAVLSNASGYLGYTSNSSDNAAIVTDTGSVWSNQGYLIIGYYGSHNRMSITNGGGVIALYGEIGSRLSARSNVVSISGLGAFWINNNGTLNVGTSGTGNSLTIANSGTVFSTYGRIGLNLNSSNNAVAVTGAGAVWSNLFLSVGYMGFGNRLTITNGGTVITGWGGGSIGTYSSGLNGGNSNAVTVTGSDSLWNCDGDINVGYWGSSNSLTIADGGTVSNQNAYIGGGALAPTGGVNNAVLVAGPGSVWNSSSNLFIGYSSTNNTLSIANGGVVRAHNVYLAFSSGSSGTLTLNGGTLRANNLIATNAGSGFIHNSGAIAILGGTLQLNNTFTNNGTIWADGSSVLDFYGPVVNNALIVGTANFHSTFVNNGSVLTATGDADGDGISNSQEMMAGTNPTNSFSRLRIVDIAIIGNDVQVTWTVVGGHSYVVQTNSTPDAGFADLSPVFAIPGTAESTTNYLHSGGATNRSASFYRVRLNP